MLLHKYDCREWHCHIQSRQIEGEYLSVVEKGKKIDPACFNVDKFLFSHRPGTYPATTEHLLPGFNFT